MRNVFFRRNMAGLLIAATVGICAGALVAAYEFEGRMYEQRAREIQECQIVELNIVPKTQPIDTGHIRLLQKYNPALTESDASDYLLHIRLTVERFKQDPFYSKGAAHKVSPELVTAVMLKESGAKAMSVSKCGAMGLLQIMPLHVKNLHRAGILQEADALELFEAEVNITAGVYVLMNYARNYKDIGTALAAYNAGQNNIKAGRGYARRVLQLSREIEGI